MVFGHPTILLLPLDLLRSFLTLFSSNFIIDFHILIIASLLFELDLILSHCYTHPLELFVFTFIIYFGLVRVVTI